MKKVFLFSVVSVLLLLLLSGCFLVDTTPVTLKVYVTDYNSGAAVSDAKISLLHNGIEKLDIYTNEKGEALINLPTNRDIIYVDLIVTKDGHSVTRINNLKLEKGKENIFETQLRVSSSGKTNVLEPLTVNLELYGDSAMSKNLSFVDNVLDVSTDTLYYKVTVESNEYKEKYIYVKLGSVPGSGFFTNPRDINYGSPAEGSISTVGFDGLVPLYVAAFDQNENLVVNVYYLNIHRKGKSVDNYYQVEYKDGARIFAYTRRGGIAFYGGSDKINKKADITLRKPQAAPEKDTNLWVEVKWISWEQSSASSTTDQPDAYVVYRSFDGESFEEIATVPEGYNYYRDKSPRLEVGKEVWYKVGAKYGDYVATPTLLGSVVPLDIFGIKYISPVDGATNVSTNPIFSWEIVNPVESKEGTPVYYFDIWLYDNTVNDSGYYSLSKSGYPKYNFLITTATSVEIEFSNPPLGLWWVDYAAKTWYPYVTLQKNKTYEWGNELAVAVVSDEDSEAYSIYADLGKIFDPFKIEAEIYNTFTTGEN
ncbi:hypothetical protein [Thermosipho sp. 1074]|uniref:hypothetical protein n=1 Tax=Thermosipho sp. 1074 TaxID=1643331 RepID=UPI0009845245|nr:hypothetical protein [Thermosipho sp. 1074]OOC42070.1 hypothetical protein XO08_07195 [Thermosipho sp. 1074]